METGVRLDIKRLVQSDPFGRENYLCMSDHPLKLKSTEFSFAPN